ncbi:MAG: type II toxin-antitoxin system Phd/YefM family antitoxin [Verrucomicrobia bacterium]|jgi:prevent-host-death family protein|nr:type II toxin-antitoxin system Phd/YefM family antitoxin [Verrucomicrobiota bacterium]MBT7700099.1 type II toxin-antitoxin system Phd/YefM family antitoxin [Verrucomicrobiota bacterium]
MTIAAGEFKTHCLQLMDQVHEQHRSFVVTKRGKPVAKLVPVDEESSRPVFGCLKGRVQIAGDIVAPTGESWNADA